MAQTNVRNITFGQNTVSSLKPVFSRLLLAAGFVSGMTTISDAATVVGLGPTGGLGPSLSLVIGNPSANSQVNIGTNLTVTGVAGGIDKEGQRAIPDSIIVQLGNLAPVHAALHFPLHGGNWTYSAVFPGVALQPGPTGLSVHAVFADNETTTAQETVFASLGGTPLQTTFTADVTLKTSASGASGPFHDTIPIGAWFSGDRSGVRSPFHRCRSAVPQ